MENKSNTAATSMIMGVVFMAILLLGVFIGLWMKSSQVNDNILGRFDEQHTAMVSHQQAILQLAARMERVEKALAKTMQDVEVQGKTVARWLKDENTKLAKEALDLVQTPTPSPIPE